LEGDGASGEGEKLSIACGRKRRLFFRDIRREHLSAQEYKAPKSLTLVRVSLTIGGRSSRVNGFWLLAGASRKILQEEKVEKVPIGSFVMRKGRGSY